MDKKKRIALLLMAPKRGMHEDEEDGAEEGSEEPDITLEDVAGDLIDAIASKDRAGVAEALRAAIASCSDD